MAKKEVIVLSEKDIMRAAIKSRGTTQQALAKKMGVVQSTLSGCLTREHISVDKFKAIMSALDYDIYIVDRKSKEAMWCVDDE